jgi:hypothetical protein
MAYLFYDGNSLESLQHTAYPFEDSLVKIWLSPKIPMPLHNLGHELDL